MDFPKLGWTRQQPDARDYQFRTLPRVAASLPSAVSLAASMSPRMLQKDLGACHDDKTDVLTDSGWKRFADLDGSEMLASVNPETTELRFETPKKLIRYQYDGDMHYGEHSFLNFAVTPDHKMLVRELDGKATRISDSYKLVPASKLCWYSGLMASVSYQGTKTSDTVTIKGVQHRRKQYQQDKAVPMTAWLEFLGIYLAEGTMVRKRTKYLAVVGSTRKKEADYPDKGKWRFVIQLAASKIREKEFIRKVLIDLDVKFHEQSDRFQFSDKRVYKALESLGLRDVKAPYKFVPEFVFQQSGEQIKAFLRGHAAGDGSEQYGMTSHYTSSVRLAEDLHTLIFLSGSQGYVGIRPPRSGIIRGRKIQGKFPEHRVSAHKNSLLAIDRKKHITTAEYHGEVFCAEMPTHHTLVTRRNGCILISGNCGPNTASEAWSFDQKVEGINLDRVSRLFNYYTTRQIMGTTGQDSGVDNRSMLKALNKYGVCPESMLPYDTSKFTQKPSQACYTAALPNRITNYAAVATNLNAMKGSIASGHSFIFGFDVFESIMSSQTAATGVIPDPQSGETPIGGHDILCWGFQDSTQQFYVTNHWDGWGVPVDGIAGCGYISYAYAGNASLCSDFWAINAIPGQIVVPPPVPIPIPIPTPIPIPPPIPFPSVTKAQVDAMFAALEAAAVNAPILVQILKFVNQVVDEQLNLKMVSPISPAFLIPFVDQLFASLKTQQPQLAILFTFLNTLIDAYLSGTTPAKLTS